VVIDKSDVAAKKMPKLSQLPLGKIKCTWLDCDLFLGHSQPLMAEMATDYLNNVNSLAHKRGLKAGED
jgi:hypothetical protein